MRNNLRDPKPKELELREFNAVWEAIKEWDIERSPGEGRAGATGTDVISILDALGITKSENEMKEKAKGGREMSNETSKEQVAGRPRYWEECGVEEKIERSREQIKNLQREVEVLEGIIGQLAEHSHAGGKIVIPFGNQLPKSERAYRRGREDKEVYF